MQGLIIGNIANLYKIKVNSKIYNATARGRFKKDDTTPVVGDLVEIQIIDEEKLEAVIEKIHPRKTYIKRPKVANVSKLVCVLSVKDPKPDLLMLDKQLAYAEYLNIEPIIVINKIDLEDNYKEIEEIYTKIGYKVYAISAKNVQTLKKLKHDLKNKISVLAGNSGVGKSTTINAIFKNNITQEGIISERNKRGKNTTTDVRLYEIDENSYIVDTPGFSTFEISEIESKDLDKYFKEFKTEIENCRYVGCTHIKENECGIKYAVEQGIVSVQRYERFCKIYSELKEKEERKW
jgi:ribosome biogenesis GTPase